MERGDRISGSFWLIFSLVVAIESYRLGLGTLSSPLTGFLPFVASVALGILSLTLLISNKLGQKPLEKGEDITFNRQSFPKVAYVAISLFAYGILLAPLGFILDTVILVGFVFIGAISAPLISYLIFDVLLKVQLPKGFLSF
jgi:hypothetical protein